MERGKRHKTIWKRKKGTRRSGKKSTRMEIFTLSFSPSQGENIRRVDSLRLYCVMIFLSYQLPRLKVFYAHILNLLQERLLVVCMPLFVEQYVFK